MDSESIFKNHDEAMEAIRNQRDKVVQALLQKADAHVVRAYGESRLPSPGFDYLFFISMLEEIFADKDRIRAILDGDFNRWFDED